MVTDHPSMINITPKFFMLNQRHVFAILQKIYRGWGITLEFSGGAVVAEWL